MKKIIITLTLGFICSLQIFASNSILNDDKSNLQADCISIEVEVYFSDCPDGSTYYSGCDVLFTDCWDEDVILGWYIDDGPTYEEACGD